ncbi:MAG: hypothetical protein IJE40_07735, partial [Clostridia bacterium]|nr:hypothetical protein [Clostridia bacterium]
MNTTKYRKREEEAYQPRQSVTEYSAPKAQTPTARRTEGQYNVGSRRVKLPDVMPDSAVVENSMGKQAAARSFSYKGTKPTYASPYSQQIDRLFNEIRNVPEFSYAPDTDETYLALEKQYRNLGQRAMKDTSSQIAAQTGGIASSYAASAGAQAYNQYMSELSGFIPELQQLAYEMYQGDLDKKYKQLDALNELDSNAYNRYLADREQQNYENEFEYKKAQDELQQQNYEKEFAHQQEQDRIAQNNYLSELKYRMFLDELEQLNYEGEFAYKQEQDALKQQNYNREISYEKYLDEISQQNYENERRYDLMQDVLDRVWEEALTKAEFGDMSGLLELGFDLSNYGTLDENASGGVSVDIYSDEVLDRYVTDFIRNETVPEYPKASTVDYETARKRAQEAFYGGALTA